MGVLMKRGSTEGSVTEEPIAKRLECVLNPEDESPPTSSWTTTSELPQH
jgi:hypothetical protein